MTAPSVRYLFRLKDGREIYIDNPQDYPDPSLIEDSLEPYIRASILCPERHIGAVMKLALDRRGISSSLNYQGPGRTEMVFELPLAEVVYDFYDKLKSVTQGYGSFDYELLDYRSNKLVKVDILLNGEKVDALSVIVHKERARPRALNMCDRLKDELPRQQFKIAIQGAIGGEIIARSTISAFRKDVTAKCYGGDITRKRKLLEKQKKGKKRLKMVGQIEVPQSAFIAVLKSDDD
jgi:GTP-binding protein LepA